MERRKRVRQDLALPLEILEVNGTEAHWSGVTRNLSSGGGICFWSDLSLSIGSKVRYLITLAPNFPPVKIVCGGVVVRCVAREMSDGVPCTFEIAMTMSRYRFFSGSQHDGPQHDAVAPLAPLSPTVVLPSSL